MGQKKIPQIFQISIKALIRNDVGQILMVHIPEWSGNQAHWDLPGGRIDEGESFTQTLNRELLEEIGVTYTTEPEQLMTFKTNITIPYLESRISLVYVVYDVRLPADATIKLDPSSAEDNYQWFTTDEAVERMRYKFSPKFCELLQTM